MNDMTSFRCVFRTRALSLAIALSGAAIPAFAQHSGHSNTHPATAVPDADTQVIDPHAGHAMPPPREAAAPTQQPTAIDHAAMGHAMPMPGQPDQAEPIDHSAMGHDMATPSKPASLSDHQGHDMSTAGQEVQAEPMDHSAIQHDTPMPIDAPRTPIPVLTEADRLAAFPEVAGHAAHDRAIHSFWLLDRLEGWNADDGAGAGIGWEAIGWVGTDLDRAWLRTEGEHTDGAVESGEIEVLYGHSVSPWWELVAGVRHDFGEGPSQTFAAIGLMGLAPQKFEVEATAYIGQSGQTAARLEVEYDTLLTNRLILQWQAEAEFHGKDDARRGIGSGLGTVEAGLRLRYEFTRKFAPYIGVAWERAFGGTADLRSKEFEEIDDARFVAGLRVWF